jgi:hypothetical protein
MHVVLDSVEEELMHCVRGLISITGRFVGLCDFFTDSCKFICGIEIRNNSRIKCVLNIFEERLLDYIVI